MHTAPIYVKGNIHMMPSVFLLPNCSPVTYSFGAYATIVKVSIVVSQLRSPGNEATTPVPLISSHYVSPDSYFLLSGCGFIVGRLISGRR